jgi:predicted ATPase
VDEAAEQVVSVSPEGSLKERSMLLRKLEAVNFRLLERFELEFHNDVTVLVGANNAGKSNVVDALLFPRDAIVLTSYSQALQQRHGFDRVISGHQIGAALALTFEFSGDEAAIEYGVEIDSTGSVVESRRSRADRPHRMMPASHNIPALAQDVQCRPFLSFFQGIIHIDPFRRVAFKTTIGQSAIVHATGDDLAQVLHYHHNNDRERFEAYEDIVRRVLFDVKIIDTPIVDGPGTTVTIRFNDDPAKYDLSQLSSGVKDVLVLLAAIHFSPRGSLLLIEEPENHLHPSAQKSLAAILRETAKGDAKQTVLTTHSELFLEPFEPNQVFFIDRHEGRARATRLDEMPIFTVWERLGIERTRLLEALGRSRQAIVVAEARDDIKLFEPIWERYELAQSILPACAGGGGWKSLIEGGRDLQDALDRVGLSSIVFLLLANGGERDAKLAYLTTKGFDERTCHVWDEKELESYLLIPQALVSVSGLSIDQVTRAIQAATGTAKDRLEQVLDALGAAEIGKSAIMTNAVRAGEEHIPAEFKAVVEKLSALLGTR